MKNKIDPKVCLDGTLHYKELQMKQKEFIDDLRHLLQSQDEYSHELQAIEEKKWLKESEKKLGLARAEFIVKWGPTE